MVEEWAGDGGRVVEFGTRFTKPVVVPADGSQIEVSGVVKSVDEQARRATVELDHVQRREGARPLPRGRAARLMREGTTSRLPR